MPEVGFAMILTNHLVQIGFHVRLAWPCIEVDSSTCRHRKQIGWVLQRDALYAFALTL